MSLLDKKTDRILEKYGDNITGLSDLLGGDSTPSNLFYLIAAPMSRYLDTDPSVTINEKSLRWRRKTNWIVKRAGQMCLPETQVIEDRNLLIDPEGNNRRYENEIVLPDEAVIYVSNHGFMDDVMTSVLTAKRHTYYVTNGLPEMCNSIDGVLSWFNGVILANHRVKSTKQAVIPKAINLLQHGTDLVIFPEGVWNKTPNRLALDLWPGVYKIARESKAMIVPIVHYIEDAKLRNKSNTIHTVVDDPFRIDHLSEEDALLKIRDIFATWQYLMMEKYGRTQRSALIPEGKTFDEVWSNHLMELLKTCERYDKEMETSADFRPRDIVLPQDVWRPISQITNINPDTISHYLYAQKKITEEEQNDYQRRY